MRTTGRRKTTSKQGPGKNSACPLISSRSPHTRSDQSGPTFAGIRPTDVPPFRAAQIVGARFAFFVSLAHVKDRLKQGDGVFESGLGNRYFGFVWACLTLTIVVKTSSSAAAVWKTAERLELLANTRLQSGSEVRSLTRLYLD